MAYTLYQGADPKAVIERGLEIEDAFDTLMSVARLNRVFRRQLGLMTLRLNPLSPKAPKKLPVVTSALTDDRAAQLEIMAKVLTAGIGDWCARDEDTAGSPSAPLRPEA